MADSASESDTDGAGGSGGGAPGALPGCPSGPGSAGNTKAGGIVISPFRLEELTNRLASLQQENKVLKIELETYKLKCKALQEENRDLRKASVTIVLSGWILDVTKYSPDEDSLELTNAKCGAGQDF
ncbi:Coiled-coil domain-containing protein 6 [Varanus komodoensis]|nr:Coiled-coil domain-containing protein 6 [Varanus komodoensis]